VGGFVVAAAGFATLASAAMANPSLESNKLYLRTGVVDTQLVPSVALNRAAEAAPLGGHYVIQLDGPMTADRRASTRVSVRFRRIDGAWTRCA
jgi:hypothetical protein